MTFPTTDEELTIPFIERCFKKAIGMEGEDSDFICYPPNSTIYIFNYDKELEREEETKFVAAGKKLKISCVFVPV